MGYSCPPKISQNRSFCVAEDNEMMWWWELRIRITQRKVATFTAANRAIDRAGDIPKVKSLYPDCEFCRPILETVSML